MVRHPKETEVTEFSGFGTRTAKFLRALEAHNERDWFQAHKQDYEAHVVEPSLGFVTEFGDRLDRISKHFDAVAKRSGGSLMRVYRDTRFSKDKTPYKTNIGVQFRHETGKDVHAPSYYLHLANDECFLGVGLWRPDGPGVTAIRDAIVDQPTAWKRAIGAKGFKEAFALEGSALKRTPKGFGEDHPLIGDLKRKDFIAVHRFGFAETASADFVDYIEARARAATPFMRFLARALELTF